MIALLLALEHMCLEKVFQDQTEVHEALIENTITKLTDVGTAWRQPTRKVLDSRVCGARRTVLSFVAFMERTVLL